MTFSLTTLRTNIRQQRGSTLLVALIMLVLLTLVALSAIKSTMSSIQVVGNAQFREEARAAAQQAIEVVMSTGDFSNTLPADQNIDVNQDGNPDYTVTFTPDPICLSSVPINLGDPQVPPVCTSNSTTDSPAIKCWQTTWDISATVNDASTGASLVMHQGVKTIVLAQDCQS